MSTPLAPRFAAALARIRNLDGVVVAVGIQSSDGSKLDDDGVALVDVATWNEFGTETIPARPWLRTALDTNRKRWTKAASKAVKEVIDGGTGEAGLRLLGVVMVGDAKESLLDGAWTPNAPATIEKKTIGGKRGDQPLVDTGRLVQSQRAEVRLKDGGKFLVG
jgi:hypothetical protein